MRTVRKLSHSLKSRYRRETKLLKQPAETRPHLWTRERTWSDKTWRIILLHFAVLWIQMFATASYFRQVLWEEIKKKKKNTKIIKKQKKKTAGLCFCFWQDQVSIQFWKTLHTLLTLWSSSAALWPWSCCGSSKPLVAERKWEKFIIFNINV